MWYDVSIHYCLWKRGAVLKGLLRIWQQMLAVFMQTAESVAVVSDVRLNFFYF